MAIAELLVRYEDEAMIGLSPRTCHARQTAVLRLAHWVRPRDICEASTDDIVGLIDCLGFGGRTRSSLIGHLHAFYDWCVNEGLAVHNPAAPLRHVRAPILDGDLPELLRGWVIAQERRALARSTITKRSQELRLLYDWLAPRSVLDATREDIERYLDARWHAGRRMSPKTRYAYLSNLHAFYTWARREGLAAEDPTEMIDRPRVPQNVPRPIKDSDLALALDKADAAMRLMLMFAAFAGLRTKEIAGVRREDILDHLDEPVLVVTSPKGRRQRTVPVHPDLLAELTSMPRSGHLFTYMGGRPYPAWKVSQEVSAYLHGCGINATCHQLRHFFATKVYGLSLDLRLTQELLGHSSPTTTAIYTKYNQAAAAGVVARLTVAAQ